MSPPGQPAAWLDTLYDHTLLVLCGSGGVGKTTTSAALAIEAAVRGQRVLVMTIDPARRLAQSLGLQELGNAETPIDLAAQLPDERVAGTLHASMLDTAAAFEELLDRLSPSPEETAKVRRNRLFRLMLGQMAGVQEYLAGEKVYDAASSGRYDLIVLDTPPTRNALDFLDSPGRIAAMLDERIVRWFLPEVAGGPVRGGNVGLLRQLVRTSGNVVKKVLGRAFGGQLMDEIEAFLGAMASMRFEFRRRSQEVQQLMSSPATAFLLVTTTSEAGAQEAAFFHGEILQRRLPFAGFVINRIHPFIDAAHAEGQLRPELVEEVRRLLGPPPRSPGEEFPLVEVRYDVEELVSALQQNVQLQNELAAHDRRRVAALMQLIGSRTAPVLVPLLPDEVHDLPALRTVASYFQ